ncbi:glycoside hydrolase family 16 protein [Algoriphagus sediminis]|uniref:Glycoside hydrolase family 16 protein n=1 Tax=Algoriphagus sediminis TaxID=3057113 RepID=A0ABT7Y8R3_9BACT|nr:glycoside hydrolase family 16 protein [Algoriphagus sediminis]MDN3202634.1 glycoside hydrolase family 16 protein [Algoriphagus sediminis]
MCRRLFPAAFLILLLVSCGGSEPNDPVPTPDPSNLQIDVEFIGDGIVVLDFTADNALFFKVNWGESGSIPNRVDGNSANLQYKEKGQYSIVVQAHSAEDNFVVAIERIIMNNERMGLDPNTGYETPDSYPDYELVWRDEFDGTALSDDWTYEIGDGCPGLCGWGNDELQFYKEENTKVEDGFLTITAKPESAGTRTYTSSRLITKGKQFFTYGRIDIRAVMPKGQGLWPALWMLGENIDEIGWPNCGEIDIMEMVGGSTNNNDGTVHGTVHWDSNGNYANYGGSTELEYGTLSDEPHVYSIIWDEREIRWLLDDVEYHVIDITPGDLEEFHKPHFFIMNVAVGGRWPGNPDGSTIFPQEMRVDYIRVFQKP